MLALISVSNKTGIKEFAKSLQEKYHFEILSTGGTLKILKEAGIKVTSVEEYTGFPEMMNGRVKTLHPKIHGGLLALRENDEHQKQAEENDIKMIDLVCVNLYPFEETIAKTDVTLEEAIENIDIGGPGMLRSAAKNYQSVTVLTDPDDYEKCLKELEENNDETSMEFRKKMALKVFTKTAKYDTAISQYFSEGTFMGCFGDKIDDLRYGENPHQKASLWKSSHKKNELSLITAKIHQGKSMSFLNYYDADAALQMVRYFKKPTATCVKHANPCGLASSDTIEEAFVKSFEADPRSAFGVIIALNRECSEGLIQEIFDRKMFVEIIIAPTYENKALEMLSKKKNIRVIATGDFGKIEDLFNIKQVSGGYLMQESDTKVITKDDLQFVTRLKPTEDQIRDLIFAANTVKYIKSNAIVLVKDECTVGVGAGQMSRVDSTEIAVRKAAYRAKGSVIASDAFFPFPDSVEEAHKFGITAIIQPGGSIRDEEVIAKANELGIPMVFTGTRAFKH